MADRRRELLRGLSQFDYAILQDLCDANGISEEQLVHRAEEVLHLEMFMKNFNRMRTFQFFPAITSLCIMQQNITTIEALETCSSLEKLWLCENKIERIQGLEGCTNLIELFLHNNKIRRIENLGHLTKVERLWLSNNQIVTIEGLEGMTKLKELNLALNQIDQLGDVFSANLELETLNLAANQIGSFREVVNLSRLPRLANLCFSDPHYGENPVSSLCNYQTYVLFNIQQLSYLDTLALADETKQLAEATYMKKKMYYNMRIKTLRRNTTNALRRAHDGKQARVGQANLTLNMLLRQQKDLEREIEGAQYGEQRHDAEYLQQLNSKNEVLKSGVEKKSKEVASVEDQVEECYQRVYELSDLYVRRMLVELETGGNIRLEDGKATDLWYSSCVDLINSRYFPGDFAQHDVAGIKVTRVTRIHNRFLRHRFEERLDQLVDMNDASYKRSLEYLFCGEARGLPGELQRVTEEGFRHSAEYAALGLDGAVSLSNSVGLCDLPRIQAHAEGKVAGGKGWHTGQLLVTKVFLGKCSQESSVMAARRAAGEKQAADGGGGAGGGSNVRVTKDHYQEFDSVYRVKQSDPKQRMWYVFDHALVLPEYLVEFEYELKRPVGTAAAPGLTPYEMQQAEEQLKLLDFDVRPIARPIATFLASCGTVASLTNTAGIEPASQAAAEADEVYAQVLNMPPALPARPKVYLLSEETIQKQIGESAMAAAVYLNFHGNSIRKVEALSSMVNLKVLVLSFNEVQKMEGLGDMPHLERLELSFNLIRRIEGLKGLTSLHTLELNNNLVYRLEDINVLKKYVPQLTSLNLRNNAVCDNKSYRGLVLRRLSSLTSLDRVAVTPQDLLLAAENSSTLTTQLIRENSYSRRRSTWSLAERGAAGAEDRIDPGAEQAATDEWWAGVEEVVLEHRRLRRLQNLEKLVNIRRASFSDNEVTRIEGLEACTRLEELSMEDNRLHQIEGMQRCTSLKKLDLGKNKIVKIENLEMLTGLTQLSLEDNEITSLAGLSTLVMLMELYIGNNKVAERREVQHLKELPKLIILDLLGNPICQTEDYRYYLIYHLRKLKVLDGQGIEAAEQATAKGKYAGKLTLDFLEEKVGHRFFEHLRDLDISQCRIRDVGSVFASEEFQCLRELNLDNNMLTDVSALRHLGQLQVLRLNHNRLEGLSLGPLEGEPGAGAGNLEVLQLGNNQISSIPALNLRHLPNIKVLFLQDNELNKIEGLEHVPRLRELVLDRNRIKYFEAGSFAGLGEIRELRIEENGLRSLSHLAPLESLQALHVGCNRVTDAQDVDKIAALTDLLDLSLNNNPIARKQVYRPMVLKKCPTVRVLDGKEVTLEEREYVESLFAPSEVVQQAPVTYAQGGVGPGVKVPIKLHSMNFESLIVPHTGGLGSISVGASPGSFGLEAEGLPLQNRPAYADRSKGLGAARPGSHERGQGGYLDSKPGGGGYGGGGGSNPWPGRGSGAGRATGSYGAGVSRKYR